MIKASTAILLLTSIGCTTAKHAPIQKTQLAESASHRPVSQALETLIAASTVDAHAFDKRRGTLSETVVPTAEALASDGVQHTLLVDEATNLAWIRRQGGIGGQVFEVVGPWPVDSAEVQSLWQAMNDYQVESRNR